MEHFTIIVNGSFLDIAAVLDPPLEKVIRKMILNPIVNDFSLCAYLVDS